MPPPVAPGDVVANKYRIVRELGRGGMGVVHAADHLQLPQQVAIKCLLSGASSTAVVRFEREARIVVRMRSEHVCRVLDIGSLQSGEPFIVMELLEGQDLAEHVLEEGPLDVVDAVDYILQACEALMEAHSLGVVHRDLKPSNLFLSRRLDGSGIIKVLDFGISKSVTTEHDELTQSGTLLGSPRFMAPEQLVSAKRVTPQTDVWALGVVLHELLTGQAAFEGATPAELFVAILQQAPIGLAAQRPELPPGLGAVVAGAIQKVAEDRYPNVAAFAHALTPYAPPHAQPLIDRILRMAQATGWSPPALYHGDSTRPAGTNIAPTSEKGRMAALPLADASARGLDDTVSASDWTIPPTAPAIATTPPKTAHDSALVTSSPEGPFAPSAGFTADTTLRTPVSNPKGGHGGIWLGLSLGLSVAVVAVAGVVWLTRSPAPTRVEYDDGKEERSDHEDAPTPMPCQVDYCDFDMRLDPKVTPDVMAPLEEIEKAIESKLGIDDPELVSISAGGISNGKFHPRLGQIVYSFRYEGPDGEHERAMGVLNTSLLSLMRTANAGQRPIDPPKCVLDEALEAAYASGLKREDVVTANTLTNGGQVLWMIHQKKGNGLRYADSKCKATSVIIPAPPRFP